MNLLAIETATTTCGVAVMQDGGVVASAHLHVPRVHAQRLSPLVDDVLDHAGLQPDALDAVAVSMGPGSYTGLRIGVSTAKGWALATDAALVGVPTLEALAAQVAPFAAPGDVVCALLDARRDEVFAAAYRIPPADGDAPEAAGAFDPALDGHAPTDALAVDALADWLGAVPGRCWLVGDGAAKSRPALDAARTAPLTALPLDAVGPSASAVARRAWRRLDAGDTADLAAFEPFYGKAFHGTPAPSPLD